jgi:hypothetical protein
MRLLVLLAVLCLPQLASARAKAALSSSSSSSSASSSSGSSSSKSSGKGGHSQHLTRDPDFENWEKPVEGHSGFDAPNAEAESSSGVLDLGQHEVEELQRGETRLLEFELEAPGRCNVEVKGAGAKPELAFLDQTTRVAAVGHTASLGAGTYFVRLKARKAGRYTVRLRCPAPHGSRRGST